MPTLKKIARQGLALAWLLSLALYSARAEEGGPSERDRLALSGDFEKAKQAFGASLGAAPSAGALPPLFFYDYGTVLAKAGAHGQAYISLLRAAFALPLDRDAHDNLRLVEQAVPAAARAVRPATWLPWWPSALRTAPWQAWLVVALSASALALLLGGRRDLLPSYSLASLSVALAVMAALSWLQTRSTVAGVMATAKVKSGPAETYSDILSLDPGSLVNVEGSRDSWRKVRFLRGESGEEVVGWIRAGALLEVR